jgi:Na+/H+ antiporter NhaD/arsenite permease-like protein
MKSVLSSFRSLLKKDPILLISAFLALFSLFLVPPSTAYLGYINFSVLVLLFCLMAVVSGLQRLGIFDRLSHFMIRCFHTPKRVAIAFVLICFFVSTLITNDVALITFIPVSIALFRFKNDTDMIYLLVLETVAANLGSLLTPIGNPQNLFLYTVYDLSMGNFLGITAPLWGLCFLLVFLLSLNIRCDRLQDLQEQRESKHTSVPAAATYKSWKYLVLFIICILTVLDLLNYWICLVITLAALLFDDRTLLKTVDYSLLVTFLFFFIFVGNLSALSQVREAISDILAKNVAVISALLCQVTSNVPAAAMLAGFTQEYKSLILGVNIGGLGTIIASMASLITYKFYCRTTLARPGRFLLIFSAVNIPLLVFLLLITALFL